MRCARDGLLAGAEFPLMAPGAPALTEADVHAGRIRGCNGIECVRCKRSVVSFPSRVFLVCPTPQEVEDAYDRAEFERFLGITRFSAAYRAYACRCDITVVKGWLSLLDAYRDRELGWICRGHG